MTRPNHPTAFPPPPPLEVKWLTPKMGLNKHMQILTLRTCKLNYRIFTEYVFIEALMA